MQELLLLRSIVGEGPILQISNDRILPSWRGIKAKNLSNRSVDARVGDVLDENFASELELCGCPQVGKRVNVIVFRSGHPFEAASRNFRFQPKPIVGTLSFEHHLR